MNIALKNNQTPVQHRAKLTPQTATLSEDGGGDGDDVNGMVDRIIDRTSVSINYAASGLAGAITGAGAWVTNGLPGAVKATGSTLAGLWNTEKYGGVLKTVAMAGTLIGGVAGAVLALPVSIGMGAWQGAGEVKTDPPRQLNVGAAAKEGYKEVGESLTEFTEEIREDMREFGKYKLEPGEKPIEIPLIKTGATILAGVAGAVVGTAGAVVSGVAGAGSEFARGVGGAVTNKELNVGEKVMTLLPNAVGAVSHGAVYGLRTGLSTLGHAIENTWGDESTYGEMGAGLKGIWDDTKFGIGAAVAPQTVLLEEVKPEPPSDNG